MTLLGQGQNDEYQMEHGADAVYGDQMGYAIFGKVSAADIAKFAAAATSNCLCGDGPAFGVSHTIRVQTQFNQK